MEIFKATDTKPTLSSVHVVCGPPGLGKSWFCGTLAEWMDPKEILLIATLGREIKSVKYQQHNLDTILIEDDEWEPMNRKFIANGFHRLTELLKDLRSDEKYGAIIIDSGTGAGRLAWHEVLAPLKVADPLELPGGKNFGPYVKMSDRMETFTRHLAKLAAHPSGGKITVARPKIVVVTWHIQPSKETVDGSISADKKAEGIEYQGKVLPQIKGGFRRELQQFVDSVIFAERFTSKNKEQYLIRLRSDKKYHCKFPGILPANVDYIPNDFSAFMKMIEVALKLEGNLEEKEV